MFEKLEQCPVCKHSVYINYIICKDHLVSGESFAITQCKRCGFLFTNPRPDSENLDKYYESPEYISHSNRSSSLINLVYKNVRNHTIKQKVSLINGLKTNHEILDVGCGTGHFLQACKKNDWKINGVEPNEHARKQGEKLLKMPLTDSLQHFKTAGKMGIISFWHVLEHIPDLNETIDLAKKLLEKKGKLVIAVPNHESLDASFYKQYWAAFDVPRHLYHFSQRTMKELLKNHDLKLKKIFPMKFDAYYVSMLSEKYKCGRTNYIEAFKNGYRSNAFAKKNHNNYSSLIYIARK